MKPNSFPCASLIGAAVSLAFAASCARAQDNANGVSSLVTRATVNGTVTQTNDQASGGVGTQTASIGGAQNLQRSTGAISSNGTLVGSVTQSRSGSARAGALEFQELSIGGVRGSLTAGAVDANGAVRASIVQSSQGGGGLQRLVVGSISDSRGGSLTSQAVVAGPGITQASRDGGFQFFSAGEISGSNLQTGRTDAIVSGSVVQSIEGVGNGFNRFQRARVGDLAAVSAQSAQTRGRLTGSLTQSQRGLGDASQTVDIGSVFALQGGGFLSASGDVTGSVVQSATSGAQRLGVGAISGGSPRLAITQVTLSGNALQVINGLAGGADQRIALGTIENVTGSVTTEATVSADLSQTLGGTGSGRDQEIAIASVADTTGTVSTRGVVGGEIVQNAAPNGAMTQRVLIGSVQGTRAQSVTTNVNVNGTITQFSAPGTRQTQSVLIGGVLGSNL